MRNPRLWYAFGLILTLIAAGLFVRGASVAREQSVALQILQRFDQWCGPFVERAVFSSYFGRPNTIQDIQAAHEITANCRQAVLSWMRDERLDSREREDLLAQVVSAFDSELAKHVAENQSLPVTLAEIGYRYPSNDNPHRETVLWLLFMALCSAGQGVVYRYEQRERAPTPPSNDSEDAEQPYEINLEILDPKVEADGIGSDADSGAEEFADDDEFETENEGEDESAYEYVDEQAYARLQEHERRIESLQAELHRQKLQAQRDKKAERERLDQTRREERERREQARQREWDRSRRDFAATLQQRRESEREQREQTARRRAEEDRKRDEERKARDKQRREKQEYERREREVEIVYTLESGGHQVVPGGSAFGAEMAAQNRLRSSKSVRSYVIRNKNGKVIGSG